MADYYTLTYDIGATLGVDPEGIDVQYACVRSQYDGVVDTDDNRVKPGTWPIEISKDTTTGSVDLPSTTDPAFVPGGPMYIVEIKYYDRPSQKTVIWRSNPPNEYFEMTADRDLADVVSKPVTVVTEAMRDDIYETAQLLTVQQAATDGQVETSLEARGLPTTGAELSASTAALIAATIPTLPASADWTTPSTTATGGAW